MSNVGEFSWSGILGIVTKLFNRKKHFPFCVCVLDKKHKEISRHGRAGRAMKCTKKRSTRAKLLFLVNILLF